MISELAISLLLMCCGKPAVARVERPLAVAQQSAEKGGARLRCVKSAHERIANAAKPDRCQREVSSPAIHPSRAAHETRAPGPHATIPMRKAASLYGSQAPMNGEMLSAFQVMLDAFPGARRIGLMVNPKNPQHADLDPILDLAKARNVAVYPVRADSARAIAAGYGELAARGIRHAYVLPDGNRYSAAHLKYSALTKIAVLNQDLDAARAGIAMAYGQYESGACKGTEWYADRILRGAKADMLALEQNSKRQLVVNVRTLRDYGLPVTPYLVAQADQIIN